jgi:hypothetical protein
LDASSAARRIATAAIRIPFTLAAARAVGATFVAAAFTLTALSALAALSAAATLASTLTLTTLIAALVPVLLTLLVHDCSSLVRVKTSV